MYNIAKCDWRISVSWNHCDFTNKNASNDWIKLIIVQNVPFGSVRRYDRSKSIH